ncbi:MAG: methylase involved in ubiquinone/menaquinone biosynthesi [Parcubacteria group bacterium Gr01-1014_38]|nr:MAG: methylase involved in ubiquinone/menaquinone biosynthesi [Parcubacteria group bacterium Gr01-1014_38]
MSSLHERIKRQWAQSSTDLAGTEAFWARSAAGLALLRDVRRAAAAHARGRALDAGAGTLTYRSVLLPHVQEYRSLDVTRTHPALDYLGDVQAMPLPDGSFDTVLCAEVLEHIPDPRRALAEIRRVLRPGGKLIITVPHLGYLHNEPNDFYRYTTYGLRRLLEDGGFAVLSLEPSGGIFCFLQLIPATFLVGLAYGVPVIWPLTSGLLRASNALALWFDGHTDRRKLFALHYAAVARKP